MRLRGRLVNPPPQDPALFCDIPGRPPAWLLDCGYLFPLRFKDLLRVRAVMVSHMHLNHFAGFDHLLRIALNAAHGDAMHTVAVVGPEGITACVRSKLAGYTWNLTDRLPLRLDVWEVRDGGQHMTRLDGLVAAGTEERAANAPVFACEQVVVHAAVLDHGIPCLGFSVEQRDLPDVRREALRGLEPGPWLETLKWMAAGKRERTDTLEVNGQILQTEALIRDLLVFRPPFRIAYVTDTLFSPQTEPRLLALAQGADVLWCGAPFIEQHIERARHTHHLTARQAGWLAREAGAKCLVLIHPSRRYAVQPWVLAEDARREFSAVVEAPLYAP